MAPIALLGSYIYCGSHDFTGESTEFNLTGDGEALQSTTFGSGGWEENVIGLKSLEFGAKGWWQAGTDTVDPEVFNNIGTSQVFTAGPVLTEGAVAEMFQAAHFNYDLLGNLGELAPFTLNARGKDSVGVVRGQLTKAKGSVSATGATGTALNLGAVGASQFLYATFHAFGTPGTTITAVIESDDASNFPSATTRITFGPITTAGGSWGTRVAGSVTDTFQRLRVTAVTGTWVIAAAVAIQ